MYFEAAYACPSTGNEADRRRTERKLESVGWRFGVPTPPPLRICEALEDSGVKIVDDDEQLYIWRSQIAAGMAMVSYARREFGLPTSPADDVFCERISSRV